MWPHDQERLLVVALFTVSHAIVLWGACGLFVLAERFGWWQSCKLPRKRKDLQPSTPANQSLNKAAIGEQVLGTVVVVPLIVYLLYPALKQLGIEVCDKAPPPLARQLLEMAGMVVGCDFLFYWTHRALHQPPFYRLLHKKHHEFRATTVWASEYFGVVDFVLNVLPGVLPALAMRSHLETLLMFTALRMWQTVQSHSGFDLPFDPKNNCPGMTEFLGMAAVSFPFYGGARRHDFHHSHNAGCYSDFLPFWDWLCGTDRHYKAFWEREQQEHYQRWHPRRVSCWGQSTRYHT